MISLDGRITVSPDVLFHVLDGETVMLDLQSGKYYSMNPVGTRIWSLLAEGNSARAVIERLQQEYRVDEQQASTDVVCWIELLAGRGLLTFAPPFEQADDFKAS